MPAGVGEDGHRQWALGTSTGRPIGRIGIR
jgi:hypothetical protein